MGWNRLTLENWLVIKAGELGMDQDKLRADMKTDAVKKIVDDSLKRRHNNRPPRNAFPVYQRAALPEQYGPRFAFVLC